MSYYPYHVFFCVNQRDDGRQSCEDCGSKAMRDYAKKQCKEKGLVNQGKVRINTAGCLNRCEYGPVVVVYPDAIWYTWVDKDDIDEIIEEHITHGRPVERLMIDKADT